MSWTLYDLLEMNLVNTYITQTHSLTPLVAALSMRSPLGKYPSGPTPEAHSLATASPAGRTITDEFGRILRPGMTPTRPQYQPQRTLPSYSDLDAPNGPPKSV